ncbi:adenylyltransferase/cytidyltransferase family protein [Streptomyces diastatochromogenes]|nr:adenylyltransferase/cytidyltransferase family protein [Streptomyces diastatochromogenes]
MKRHGHGLVPGRFHPPHAGHHHLVRTARDHCERLTVLVRASAGDTLPPEDRIAWMREVHPDVLVVGGERYEGPERVDAVFVPQPYGNAAPEPYESYGDGLARRLGATTVRVAPVHPFSDTAVREDPAAFWDFLEPPVRAALTRRVVLLGAESTGTTTMARALTDHYRRRGGVWARTRRVAEYEGGFGAPGHPCAPPTSPSSPSARPNGGGGRPGRLARPLLRHRRLRRHHPARAPLRHPQPRRRRDRRPRPPAPLAAHRPPGHRPRRRPGRAAALDDRALLTQLAHTGRRTAVLTGPHEERLAAAVAAVDALLAEGGHLTEPQPERR